MLLGKNTKDNAVNDDREVMEAKGMVLGKNAKHLGSESNILGNYYKDMGAKEIVKVLGTDEYINREKEQKHIEILRKHYRDVSSSNIVFRTDLKKQKKTLFTEDDFNENGNLKASSLLSTKKNMGLSLVLPGLTAYAVGGKMGSVAKGMKKGGVRTVTGEAGEIIQSVGGAGAGLGAIMGATNTLYDYTPTTKSKARRMLKMKDKDLLRMLRGENITKEQVKVENHALG